MSRRLLLPLQLRRPQSLQTKSQKQASQVQALSGGIHEAHRLPQAEAEETAAKSTRLPHQPRSGELARAQTTSGTRSTPKLLLIADAWRSPRPEQTRPHLLLPRLRWVGDELVGPQVQQLKGSFAGRRSPLRTERACRVASTRFPANTSQEGWSTGRMG